MNSILNKFKKGNFLRNVIIVASGTAMAQVITFMFAPIITRLYGPEAFGIMATFKSIIGIIGPVAALTFPIAIVLPKSDADAKAIGKLSMVIAALIAIITAIILYSFNKKIVSILDLEEIQPYLYLIPFAIFFAAYEQVAKQWLVRTKQFSITAKCSILNSLILDGAKAGIGLFKPFAGVLVIISTLGSFVYGSIMMIGTYNSKYQSQINNHQPLKMKEIIKKHYDFPIFRAPQVFLNAFSQNLPILLLTSFFSPTSAGFYSLGMTILALPSRLIGKSVSDVLYPRINEAHLNGNNISKILIKTTLGLFAAGIIPFGIAIVFGPWIFGFVFGDEWYTAGEYVRWLSLGTFFTFISRANIVAIPILNLQGRFLIFEIFSSCLLAISFIAGYYFFKTDIASIIIYSITLVILQIFLMLWIIYSSNSAKNNCTKKL